jgi:hypothetical protein
MSSDIATVSEGRLAPGPHRSRRCAPRYMLYNRRLRARSRMCRPVTCRDTALRLCRSGCARNTTGQSAHPTSGTRPPRSPPRRDGRRVAVHRPSRSRVGTLGARREGTRRRDRTDRRHRREISARDRTYPVDLQDYYGGRGNRAYRLLSRSCRRTSPRSEYVRREQSAAQQAGPQPAPRITITYLHAGRALLAYQFPDSKLSRYHTRWICENGWRDDHC